MLHGIFNIVTIEGYPTGRHVNVNSVKQAQDILARNWPAEARGAAYFTAVRACIDQMDGHTTSGAVRKAFLAAAKEAGILVSEDQFG